MTMLFHPAQPGSKPIPEGTALKDDTFCRLIIGILLTRLDGGRATFTQEDFDNAVGMLVLEGRSAKGEFMLGIQGRGTSQ